MKQVITKLDKIILFCRNIQKTTGLYSQALGLKVYIQTPQFCELRDASNFSIYLQSSKNPSQLIKGYSPLLSFKVQNFEQIVDRLKKYDLVMEGEVSNSQLGSVVTFMGLDNQMICINNFQQIEQDNSIEQTKSQDSSSAEIKRLLQKIRL